MHIVILLLIFAVVILDRLDPPKPGFMAVVLLFALAVTAPAQVVLASPVIHWHEVEGWTIQVTGGTPSQVLSRPAILLAVPGLKAWPNTLTQDALTRRQEEQPSSWLSQAWGLAGPAASGYLTSSGLVRGNRTQEYSGLALDAIQIAVAIISKRAVNVEQYFANLLPDRVVLDNTGSGEWAVASGWDPRAEYEPIGPFRMGK